MWTGWQTSRAGAIRLAPEGFTAPIDFTTDVQTASQYAAAGGIISLNWAIYNPWVKSDGTFGNGNYLGLATDGYRVDIPGLLDVNGAGATTNPPSSNLAARAALLDWCDQTATLLKQFLPGVPVLMRPLHEMNGNWYWYGHHTCEEYAGLWKLIRDRFVIDRGMHNLVWVCSASGDAHVPAVAFGTGTAVDYYYPGDSFVDVVGAHFYDNFESPFDPDRIWARHPKVFAMPEFGSSKSTRFSPKFDNRWTIDTIRTRMPRVAYFTAWNSWTNHDDDDNNPNTPANNDDDDPLTIDTPTHKYIAIADNPFAAELLADPAVVTRDEVAFMPPATLMASPASSTAFALAWPGVPGNTGYAIETSPTGLPGTWTAVPSASQNALGSTLEGFSPATTRYLQVRTLFGSDDSLPTDSVSAKTWSLFQQWKSDTLGNFAAADLADDDHDGLVTLLEYGLGMNPLADSSAQRPAQSLVNIAGTNYLALTFRRRIGLSVAAEATGDLASGPWLADPVQSGAPADNGDGTETVTFRDSMPMGNAPRRFMRVRVTDP